MRRYHILRRSEGHTYVGAQHVLRQGLCGHFMNHKVAVGFKDTKVESGVSVRLHCQHYNDLMLTEAAVVLTGRVGRWRPASCPPCHQGLLPAGSRSFRPAPCSWHGPVPGWTSHPLPRPHQSVPGRLAPGPGCPEPTGLPAEMWRKSVS